MKTKSLNTLKLAAIFIFTASSCQVQPATQEISQEFSQTIEDAFSTPQTAPKQSAENKRSHTLRFRLNFSQDFRAQCASCRPRYIKLAIKGSQNISEPLYAVNADDNGFVEIDPNLPLQTLSSNIPEGNNWAAFAGIYTENTPNAMPLAEIGGVFHNPPPTDTQIELSKRALQTAHIVNAMHDLGDDRIFSPLDLQRYQAMTDALLGVTQNSDGTYNIGRVPNGAVLDAETLARMLQEGSLNPENTETAANISIERLLPRPQVKHSARVQGFTAGLSKLVMNTDNEQLFTFDIKQNTRRIYGLTTPGLNAALAPYDLGQLRNMYLSLGQSNPSGSAPQPVLYTYRYTGVDRMMLSAYYQQNGALAWQYNFEDTPALMSDYVPTIWRNDKGTPADPSDDTDRVFVTFNADPFNHAEKRGIYAIEEGQEIMRVTIAEDFNAAGAVTSNGKHLYVISRSDAITPSKLYAIDTENETISWSLTLPGETFTSSTPVIGKNGDIYAITYTLPENFRLGDSLPGQVVCISPAGVMRWQYPLASTSSYSPIIDAKAGQDRIYVITDRGRLVALNSEGSLRWATLLPGTAGEGPVDAPIIGEDLAEGRTLYQAMGNGLIYAVKDREVQGEILWAQAPQAKVSKGMILKDGFLYAPTLDGGEGQSVQIKAIQVHSLNVPEEAPWPLTGGNLAGQNTPHQKGIQ